MFFNFDCKLTNLAKKAELNSRAQFKKIEETFKFNSQKVLKAFLDNRVSEKHFSGTDGYGYGDEGRKTLDAVFAQIFDAQDALVRHNFINGTHALTVTFFGVLRKNDILLSVTGKPYETLQNVIDSKKKSHGSLKDFGIKYFQINLNKNSKLNFPKIKDFLIKNKGLKAIFLQRSSGYSFRKPLSNKDIKKLSVLVKSISEKIVIICDNCYCELVEPDSPITAGADLIVGSLIKNPGGGIAPTGGYIAGKRVLVEKCAYRLTAPGMGKEIGATLGVNKSLFFGLFNTPSAVKQSLKTAIFAANMFKTLGLETTPKPNESRVDIIQSVKLKNKKSLLNFCRGLQKCSPIDSFLTPEPWDMIGYNCKIIMAAGTFTQGASIELSADAPIRKPFGVWLQGSLNYEVSKMGILSGIQEVLLENNRTKIKDNKQKEAKK